MLFDRARVGVVDITYPKSCSVGTRSLLARDDGFAHIDVLLEAANDPDLALPVGCPTSFPKPSATWCATPAPPRGTTTAERDAAWERTLRWWRAAPQALLEPWAGSTVCSIDHVRALKAEIPGLRLLVDTGHVADWGGDVIEMLEFADHVQLRQGCPGHTQVHIDDRRGTVDFRAVVRRLARLGYTGRVSVEYFDLPEQGWPLDSPRQWASDLLARLT